MNQYYFVSYTLLIYLCYILSSYFPTFTTQPIVYKIFFFDYDICHSNTQFQHDTVITNTKYKGDITVFNFLSVFIGVLIAVMLPLNGILSELIGKYTASVVIHLVGLIAVIFVLIINKNKIRFDKGIPLFLYSAGAIGVFTVLLII